MSDVREVKVPDIGDFDKVDVIEVLVSVGDMVEVDDSLVTLESDKASMEIPSPVAGKIVSLAVSVGGQVGEGDVVATVEVAETSESGEGTEAKEDTGGSGQTSEPRSEAQTEESDAAQSEPGKSGAGESSSDTGDTDSGELDEAESADPDDPEIPDTEGSVEVSESDQSGKNAQEPRDSKDPKDPKDPKDSKDSRDSKDDEETKAVGAPTGQQSESAAAQNPEAPLAVAAPEAKTTPPHASPGIRRFARELGVDLTKVEGTGSKGRIVREDVESFVKTALSAKPTAQVGGIPPMPAIDFSKFGEVTEVELSRIRKVSARNLSRSWLNVPHVSQFDEADVTDLEEFRAAQKSEAERRGVKLTPLAFLMKATVAVLRQFPDFNSSLSANGESLIRKHYYHLGIAVDTPNGLVVPVIRDVDRKGLFDLALELGEVSERARQGKLTPKDIQGASFTISSLGGIGGTNFTPIVNAPEVAILGVARSKWQPVYRDREFVPRLILPFSVSYDHRVVDGAAGARFTGALSAVLSDLRRLIL